MNVIGTVGLPGSGKGEAATVAEAAGVPVVVMGDVIREECRERGLDPAEHHGRMAGLLREEEGDAVIAERSISRIREAAAEHDAATVLVDGLRSTVELERFREAFGKNFTLVAVHAPFEMRAERLGERGRDDSDSDLEALRERDAREVGLGLDDTLERADVEIDNTGSLAAFQRRIRELLGVSDESGADRVSSDGAGVAADPVDPTDSGGRP